MINIEKIYEMVLENEELTTQKLKLEGINSNEITRLVRENVLQRVQRGHYHFIDINSLYSYGRQLLASDKEKARKCFHKCYEIDPRHIGSCFQLFFESIINDRCEEAYHYLTILRKSGPRFEKDYNLYLYLLSNLILLPNEDKEYAKILEFDDVKLSTSYKERENYIDLQNRMRYAILNNRYNVALHIIEQMKKLSNKIDPKNVIIQKLAYKLNYKEKEDNKKILEMIQNKQFIEIINMIEQEKENCRLSRNKDLILELSYDILDMINHNKIPKMQENEKGYNDLPGLIYRKKYLKALRKITEKPMVDLEYSVIYQLLIIAKEEINRIQNPEKEDKNISFTSLASNLLNQNYDLYFHDLQLFLELKNKKEYYFVFENLVKISTVEEDFSYSLPMTYLVNIVKDDARFNLDFFLESFYEKIKNGDFESAKLFLDIIEQGMSLSEEKLPLDVLRLQLQQQESKDSLEEVIVPEQINEKEEQKEKLVVARKKVNMTTPSEREKSLTKYLNSSLEKLDESHPIELLRSMDEDAINYIFKYVDDNPSVIASIVEIDAENRVLLKYQEKLIEKENYKEVNQQVKDLLYQGKELQKCMELNNRLLCSIPYPYPYLYITCGWTYLRMKKPDIAATYFEIADSINKHAQVNNRDYQDFIFSLKNKTLPEDRKDTRYIHMKEYEFYDDISDTYGINQLEEILNLVKENHVNIEEIGHEFSLTSEDISIIKLVLARDYYCNKNFKQGDKILKQVERSKEKTPFVKSLMAEVQTNKKLYPYRNEKHKTSYEKVKK